MNKRSAMAMAAGLVAALLAGTAALSIGLSAPETAQARSDRSEPVVWTITETVKVHKKAKGDRTGTVQVVSAPAAQPVSSASDDVDEDAYEDDAYEDDDAYEGEEDDEDGDHEDEGGGDELDDD